MVTISRSRIFSLLVGLLLIGVVIFLLSRQQTPINTSSVNVTSPTEGQTFISGSKMTISWEGTSTLIDPFVLMSIQDRNGKFLGTIESKKIQDEEYTWDTDTIAGGDILRSIDPGEYRLQIVGYRERFCYNGECGAGSQTSSPELFKVYSPYFDIK